MNITELPETKLVGVGSSPRKLMWVLERATLHTNIPFLYSDRIEGGPQSSRILFHELIQGFPCKPASFTVPLDNATIGSMFFEPRFLQDVRFSPAEAPSENSEKAWEVSVLYFKNKRAVILKAVWI